MQINLWIIVIKAPNKSAGEVRKILLTKATLRLSTFLFIDRKWDTKKNKDENVWHIKSN